MNNNDIPQTIPADQETPTRRFLQQLVHWLKYIASGDVRHTYNESVRDAIENVDARATLAQERSFSNQQRLSGLDEGGGEFGFLFLEEDYPNEYLEDEDGAPLARNS